MERWSEKYRSECPYVRGKFYGEDAPDLCTINDKICLLEEGLECETWNEVQKEWEQEAAAARSK